MFDSYASIDRVSASCYRTRKIGRVPGLRNLMIRSFQPSEVSRPSATSRAVDPYARKTRAAYETLSFSAVGLEMGLAVVIGLLFGRWLDGKA